MKKLLTIIGVRPQFVKASVVSKALADLPDVREVVVHTGQHFEANMSDVFFNELGVPQPEYQLNIHSGSPGDMIGRMLIEVEKVLLAEKPDIVLVYGDANTTLAGALAASKLQTPIAHVEAGLRTFNRHTSEETNRILVDKISDILFCSTRRAVDNLEKEARSYGPIEAILVGDVMKDAALYFSKKAFMPRGLPVTSNFILATTHRAENLSGLDRALEIISALNDIHKNLAPVVMPLHPRARRTIKAYGLTVEFITINPVGYLESLWLLQNASLVLTDSGGMQKEAFFFRKPCVTMRDQTEYLELVDIGANIVAGVDKGRILRAAQSSFGQTINDDFGLYGDGNAAKKIAARLQRF